MKQSCLKSAIATLGAFSLITLSACSSDNTVTGEEPGGNEPTVARTIELSPEASQAAAAVQDFNVDFFRNVALSDEYKGKNVACSPVSATMLLSLLSNAASNEAATEIATVLGYSDTNALNDLYTKLSTELPALDPKAALAFANSVWYDKQYTLTDAFSAVANNCYKADVFKRDLSGATPGVKNDINSWVSGKTKGLIKNITVKMPALSALINATYFKAGWTYPFDKKYTSKATFKGINGDSEIDMMVKTETYLYDETEDYKIIEVPFGTGAFAATFILPTNGPEDFLKSDALKNILNKELHKSYRSLFLPRFKIAEDEEINRLTVSAGKDFTIKDTVMLFASEEAQLKAGGNFELGQGSVLAGDGLVKVEAGKDVSLKHGSGIEGFSSDGVENLEIHAERNVHQDASADGIASDRLEVSAGGSVELLAQKSAKDKELGNRVDELIVSADSDINLVLNGQKQEIQINEEKGNIINGNLTIENYNGPLSVGYELTVNGHAEMKADSVLLKDLQASQDIYLEANGEIRANELASGADVTIVQRSADPSAAVVVKNVDAGDQIFVLNAGGPISLEKSVSGNSTMIFVSQDGYKPDRNVISSRSNRVGIFAAAPQMLSVFDRFGREISYLSKDSLQADQRHHHYALYRYGEDTHMPASRLFFNGYRAESVSPSNGLIKEALLFVTNRWQVNMGEEGAEEETED